MLACMLNCLPSPTCSFYVHFGKKREEIIENAFAVLMDDLWATRKYEEPSCFEWPLTLSRHLRAWLRWGWSEKAFQWEIAALREEEEEETHCDWVERERTNGIREEIAGWLFRENLPFRWKGISQPGPGSGEANMIGFGCETWGNTLPEDEGERMWVVKEKRWAGEETLSQGVFIWEKLGGPQPAEAGVTSFAVRMALIHLSWSDNETMFGNRNVKVGFRPCPALPVQSHPTIIRIACKKHIPHCSSV